MPIAGGIVLAVALVVLIATMAKPASAATRATPLLPPGVQPGPPGRVPPEIATAVDAIEKGQASPETVGPAIEKAKEANLPKTAEKLATELDKAMTRTIPALVSSADVDAAIIPADKATGKPLWFLDARGGKKMAIPNFPGQLAVFKALQKQLGVKQDGRIGPATFAAFTKKVSVLGFSRFPGSIEVLAANALKWTEVLKEHFRPGEVGRPLT